MSAKGAVFTTCTRDCPNACGLAAVVEDGRLTRLSGHPDHPLTRGVACVKASRYAKRVYDPERVTHPLIRRENGWERATWDEALDLVAERMKTVMAESGNEAVLYYQGYGERTGLKLLNKYFFNLLGGATFTRGSLCGGTGQASQNLDFGVRVSHDPLDHENSAAMILWARNPVSTNISLTGVARRLKARGGKVLLIDPARSKSAAIADRHIAPIPGKDVFLAMAAAKLILAAGAEDRDFLENHSVGAREYLDILARYEVNDLCARAGVAREDADSLADMLMTMRPTSILLGWGLHRREYAHLSIRAIDALGAIAGIIGVPGGGVSQGFEEYGPYDQALWGDGLNPPRRALLLPRIGQEILAADNPKIRMIYVTAANPVCMAPNSAKVAEAFKSAEFVVYSGHFLDDTADCAHVFLPATTFLEETDVTASYGHNYLGPVNKAIEPVGECKSEFRMFYELSSRFPVAEKFRKSEEQWLYELCAPARAQGCDMKRLATEAFRLDAPMVPYADRKFDTPSGKYQFMTRFDPDEIAGTDAAHPYRFLTIAAHGYICSERNMAGHDPLPEALMAEEEAARRGFSDGDQVMLESPAGKCRAVLRAAKGQRPDVIVAERGGWIKAGHGLNLLTRDIPSVVGNGAPYYETAISVSPCADDGLTGTRVLCVQHTDRSPGGEFRKEIERLGAVITTVRPDLGEAVPESVNDFDALLVLGGPQHAYDDAGWPHFQPLLALMRAYEAADKPVAGICLGGQLLARAYGAGVKGLGELEFGFTELALTPEGRRDPVIGAAGFLPRLMEFHEDAFAFPEGAVPLVVGTRCPGQCFKRGRASYGFQFHLEVDATIMVKWINQFRSGAFEAYAGYKDLYSEAFFEKLAADLPVLLSRSREFCAGVARRWLSLVRKG